MSDVLDDIVLDSLASYADEISTGDQANYYDSVDGVPVPKISVRLDDGRVQVSFEPLDENDVVSTIGSSIIGRSVSYNLGDWKINNIVHDFTFGDLIGDTDMMLNTIFKRSGTEITRFTPDYVRESINHNIIVEAGTSQGGFRSIQSSYGEKKQKYETILRTIRSSEIANDGNVKPILFGIIIVGHSTVATNLVLSREQRMELQMRFKVGIRIQKELADLEVIPRLPSDASEIDKRLEQYFLKLDLLSNPIIEEWNRAYSRRIDSNDPDSKFLEAHLIRWDENRINRMINSNDKNVTSVKINTILANSVLGVLDNARAVRTSGNERAKKSDREHDEFETRYLERNKGNMMTKRKAMINIPLIVMVPSPATRVPSSGLSLRSSECKTVYDTLYSAAILKTLTDGMYFPDKEMDLLEQYGWERDDSNNTEDYEFMRDEQKRQSLFNYSSTFNLNDLSATFLETGFSLITNDVNEQKRLAGELKGKTMRFTASLGSQERFDLALKGVQGKGLTEEFIKTKRNPNYDKILDDVRNSKPDWFDIKETDTADMDELMSNVELYRELLEIKSDNATSTVIWRSLIDQSRDMHGDNFLRVKEKNHIDWFSKTNLFLWGKLITDIGTEVNISLKQNCKKDDFVFKKLQDFNVWLLIKPTRKEEKIFFSILFKTEDIIMKHDNSVFKETHFLCNSKSYQYTNFISLNESKLLNWVLFLPRMIGLFRFWSNFSNVTPYSEMNVINLPETDRERVDFYENAMPMLMLTLIIGLCDKTEVEEEITRTRYMVMESLSEWPKEPEPFKMANKASEGMRSRLTLWLYRKHRELCRQYSLNPPRAGNYAVQGQEQTETTSQLIWEGFINPYTGFKLHSGQQVINLFYLGYIKNKDEVSQINKASKLFDKILTYEVQYSEDIAGIMGISSPERPLPHCFDIDLMVDCATSLKERTLKNFPEFEYIFMKNIHSFLFQRSVEEEFATLKASSNFNESLYDRKNVNKKYQRGKVIEKLSLEREDSVSIAELFEKKYIKCLRNRGLNIDIFRKPQHGGDREIYVLGFEERVVQRLIEQVARILCGFIPEETMTHPGNKIAIPENCSKEARTRYRDGFITFNSSADASKWSQNNSSIKMLICLLVLTPKYIHKTIIRCLRLWESKRILINPFILELFEKHKDLKLYDSTLQCLFDGYKGLNSHRWIKPGRPYIEVTTGMMQGILHYSSSLYHSAVITRVKEIVTRRTGKLLEVFGYEKPFKIVMCHLQSSDDSFYSVSMPLDGTPKMSTNSRILATAILQFKVDFSSACGVVNSIKTVLNSNHVFEFNSNFEFGFNHYKPDIKSIFSGFLVSEQELLLTRQEELSVLLTSYIENGGTNYVANGLQMGQSYMHYLLIGMNTTRYFRSYEVLQSILPDPSVGFFAMDNPLCPGMLGFKFNLWNMVKNTNLGKLFKHKLRPITLENTQIEESVRLSIELSAHGSLSATYKIVHGNRNKWKALLKRMNVDEDWREKIEAKPEILFRRSLSSEEVHTKISQKMHSPGVSASLSSLNTIPRILAESAYILKLQSVTSLSNWLDPKKVEFNKVTLLEAMLLEMKEILSEGDITDNELLILFPFHNDFLRNQQLLSALKIGQIGQSFREYKRKETSVEIATNNEYTLVNLRGILLSFWFEGNAEVMVPKLSREHREYIFNQHKKTIPWIEKTLEESLIKSPFNNVVDMLLWLNTFSGRRRVVRLLGTQIISKHGHSRLLSVVVNNLSASHRLTLERTDIELPENLISEVRSQFVLLSALPGNATSQMQSLFSSYGDRLSFIEGSLRSRQNEVVLMCKLARAISKGWRRSNLDEVLGVLNDMKRSKNGIIGLFTTRQRVSQGEKGVEYHGRGVWEGIIDGYDVRITINNKIREPVHVVSIELNTELASVESISIRAFIETMGWKIQSTMHSSSSVLYLNDRGLNTSTGVPIFINPTFNADLNRFFELRLALEWTGRNLRCVATGTVDQLFVKLTVLSLSPRFQHYDFMGRLPESPVRARRRRALEVLDQTWVSNRSLTLNESDIILRNFSRFDSERQELIRTNLKAKLQNQGIIFKRKVDLVDLAFISKEEQEEQEDFLSEITSFQHGLQRNEVDDEVSIVADRVPTLIEEEDIDADNIEIVAREHLGFFEEKITPIELIKKEVWRLHALFKPFIIELIKQVGRDAINRLIEKREYNRDLEDNLGIFEIILDESRENWERITPRILVGAGSDFSDETDEDE